MIMKKIFTLVCMAAMAMSVNAQDLPENVYPIKDITWGDITWKNNNNKKDKDNNDMFFLMGTGNGYENVYCEYFINDDGNEVSRPYYTYVDYEAGETGIPSYGLYYKFTPSASGTLKVTVWVNKGNRKTFVVNATTGSPVAYTFDGYVNGQNTTEADESQHPTYFTADEIKTRHDNFSAEQVAAGKDALSDYVIDCGNQAVWGWINIEVAAGESYVVYQQTSQIGFGGFEFNGQSYAACPGGQLASEFAAVVDGEGKATNVSDKGSVVTFEAAGVAVEAVGSSTPTEVTPDIQGTGISTVKASETADAVMYNLAGQKVDQSYKGVVVMNGRKVVLK